MENQHEKNEHLLRKLGKKELYLALAKNDYEKLVSISKIRTTQKEENDYYYNKYAY